jgi:hypothetical protein
MSIPTLNALLDLAEEQARTIILKLHHELMPSWLLIDPDGTPRVIATPWNSDLEKRVAEMALRQKMKRQKTVAYSVVTEAWLAHQKGPYKPGDKRPMDRADRQEVVVAIASDGKETLYKSWHMRRDWTEQVVALEPIEQKGGTYESWMGQMLK